MKTITRNILIIICVVSLLLCGTAFGLYTTGCMGFKDGKLKFYFGQSDNSKEKPDSPQNTENPTDEPDSPAVDTRWTINLVFPDGTQQYKYDPDFETFNPKNAQNWRSAKAEQEEYYRFDGWYVDETYETACVVAELQDGDTLYAHMIAQAQIVLYSPEPGQKTTVFRTYKVDKGESFDVMDYVPISNQAQYFGVFSNPQRTIEVTETSFVANENRSFYVKWSSMYSTLQVEWHNVDDEVFIVQENLVIITGYVNPFESSDTVVIPSVMYKDGQAYAVRGLYKDIFRGNSTISEIYIPDSVKTIWAEAFSGCNSLKTAVFNSTIPPYIYEESESKKLFKSCKKLEVIYVPNEDLTNEDPLHDPLQRYKIAAGWYYYADRIQAIPES